MQDIHKSKRKNFKLCFSKYNAEFYFKLYLDFQEAIQVKPTQTCCMPTMFCVLQVVLKRMMEDTPVALLYP